MVSYRFIAVLALAATGVIAAPCDAGNGNGAGATGVANAQDAQATGAAGNAQGGAGGAGNGQGGAGGDGGNEQGGNAGGAAAGGNDAACNPTGLGDGQGPNNVGVDGAQFVTGVCTSDANCASGCCVLGGGKDPNVAVCRNEPALEPDESCGFTCAA
jgi:hypothetical protein